MYPVRIKESIIANSDVEFVYVNANDHFEYGKEIANRYKAAFRIIFPTSFKILSALSDRSPEEKVEIETYLDNCDPDFRSEVQGFGKVINGMYPLINIDENETMYLIERFMKFGQGKEGCTTTLSTDDATSTGSDTYLTQNIDTSVFFHPIWRIYSYSPKIIKIGSKNAYAAWGIPMLMETPFLNEKGLGMGGNALRLADDPDLENINGDSIYWLDRSSMMEYDNVYDVDNFWSDASRAFWTNDDWPHFYDNSIRAWCDKNGDIMMIEQTDDYYNAVFLNPGPSLESVKFPNILWHSNHHLWNDEYGYTGSIDPEEGDSSWERADKAYKLLTEENGNKYYGKIDLDACKKITQDVSKKIPNFPDDIDICLLDLTNLLMTVEMYIIMPKSLEVFWSHGNPYFGRSSLYDFSDKFDVVSSSPHYFDLDITSSPAGYFFEIGALPYLMQNLEEYNNDSYYGNFTKCAILSNLMGLSSDRHRFCDFTMTLSNNFNGESDEYLEISIAPDGIVNASLNDDPNNNTWSTIQKAVDNVSTLDTIVVLDGNYTEDLIINKSIIIFGVEDDDVVLDGTITMDNPRDYEFLNCSDEIRKINMTEIELLLHFNNDSRIGENYSNSSVVFDYSGFENNGTNNNASWTTSTIKGDGAFDFNGANNSINLSSLPALSNKNITISAWIKCNDGTGNQDTILSQSNTTHGYCLFVNNTDNKPCFRLNDTTVTSPVDLTNSWHNIVGTHNETTLKIYMDGVETGSTAKSGSGTDADAYVGFDNESGYFNGTIDEIAVWNRTLSGEEISHIYKQHYGVVLDGLTIKNGDVGIRPVNHTDITNCVLVNHSTGVLVDNLSDIKIQCNFSECNTSISLNNIEADEYNKIRVMDCNIDNTVNGLLIDSSSQIDVVRTYLNCSGTFMDVNNSNFSTIDVIDSWAEGNHSPDQPSLSGPSLGDVNTSYTYYSCTNDTDGDIIFYLFDWGDGNDSGWVGPYDSNVTVNASHTWTEQGGYYVRVKAKDIYYNESDFSEILFKTETLPPLINSVNNTPDIVGFGSNVTITANVTDDESGNYSGIASVKVNITYPNNDTGNHTMHSIGDNTYEYLFTDIWLVGQYNYTVWVVDNAYNTNSSTGHSFNVSSQANITVATLKDGYGDNEQILLTDPQNNDSSSIGYELLDSGGVLHLWNRFDHYYFNATNGIQMTNHYNEYWSNNVLMLGYYNNDQWHFIYRTDELSGFNKFITTDNESYVNITLWKNLEYQGYDFRLAIRYYLGVDDNELTVIPYIKNLGDSIPFDLGFGWEMKDIQVDMTTTGDYINVNQSIYFLNQTLNNTYTDLSESEFYLMENITNNKTKSLYLKWNDSLTYKLQVKSREGQYNAPVTLFVRIGTLDSGQSKQTKMYWYDADQVTYYFNSYDNRESWTANPGNMVDGSIYTVASTTADSQVELCNGNSCPGEDLGTISKVELRVHGYHSSDQRDIILRPVFGGTSDGNNYNFQATTTASWSSWFNIENPTGWQWSGVANLDCDVEAGTGMFPFTLYASKVEIRVTFNTAPVISNPAPIDNSVGVSPSPVLNITVSDANGDLMNITWYTNSTPNSLILRPEINGSISQLERIPGDLSANYMCVDEETVNDSDYVKWKGSTWKRDTYALSNHTGETGNIHFVKVVALCARVGSTEYPQTNSSANITLKTGGSYYYGKPFKPTYNITDPALYLNYSYIWTFNPATGSPWNWSDVDNLEAGISFIGNEGTSRCSNIYVEVNYTNSSAQWIAFGSNNSVGNGTYHQTFTNASLNGRWWYWKVLVHDGTTGVYSNVCKFYTGYESKIENTGSYNISGYLLIQVQWYNSSNSKWVVADDTVNETTPRIINIGEQFGLDTVFNGLLDTNDLSSYGNGTYRVYAALRDPDGDILVCDDETELVAMYEFSITFE